MEDINEEIRILKIKNEKLEREIKTLQNEIMRRKTILSIREYEELIDNLVQYKNIPELKEFALRMEKKINELTVYA